MFFLFESEDERIHYMEIFCFFFHKKGNCPFTWYRIPCRYVYNFLMICIFLISFLLLLFHPHGHHEMFYLISPIISKLFDGWIVKKYNFYAINIPSPVTQKNQYCKRIKFNIIKFKQCLSNRTRIKKQFIDKFDLIFFHWFRLRCFVYATCSANEYQSRRHKINNNDNTNKIGDVYASLRIRKENT